MLSPVYMHQCVNRLLQLYIYTSEIDFIVLITHPSEAT